MSENRTEYRQQQQQYNTGNVHDDDVFIEREREVGRDGWREEEQKCKKYFGDKHVYYDRPSVLATYIHCRQCAAVK